MKDDDSSYSDDSDDNYHWQQYIENKINTENRKHNTHPKCAYNQKRKNT